MSMYSCFRKGHLVQLWQRSLTGCCLTPKKGQSSITVLNCMSFSLLLALHESESEFSLFIMCHSFIAVWQCGRKTSCSSVQLRFPNSFRLTGVKHIADNLMKASLLKMQMHLFNSGTGTVYFAEKACLQSQSSMLESWWHDGVVCVICWIIRYPGFLGQLRELENLLARPYMREQFVSKCTTSKSDEAAFRSCGARLRGLRWEVVVKFCQEVTSQKDKLVSFSFEHSIEPSMKVHETSNTIVDRTPLCSSPYWEGVWLGLKHAARNKAKKQKG